MLTLWEMPKQQKAQEECSMEIIFRLSLMENTWLIWEKIGSMAKHEKG